MAKILGTKALIVGREKYLKDIILEVITPNMGKIRVIAKNANSTTSRRARQLNKGILMFAKLYVKNHYYLTGYEIYENLFMNIKDAFISRLFQLGMELLRRHYVFSSTEKEFDRIMNVLRQYGALGEDEPSRNKAFALTYSLFYRLDLLQSKRLTCYDCNGRVPKGYFLEGKYYCSSCAKDNEKELKFAFDLNSREGQIRFFENILAYWEI